MWLWQSVGSCRRLLLQHRSLLHLAAAPFTSCIDVQSHNPHLPSHTLSATTWIFSIGSWLFFPCPRPASLLLAVPLPAACFSLAGDSLARGLLLSCWQLHHLAPVDSFTFAAIYSFSTSLNPYDFHLSLTTISPATEYPVVRCTTLQTATPTQHEPPAITSADLPTVVQLFSAVNRQSYVVRLV
jgi:hypothetical protein